MKYKFLIFVSFLLLVTYCTASELEIYTEENFPAQYSDSNGNAAGWAVEIVKEIMKEIGENNKIEIRPWSRAYMDIQTKPNVAVFLMTRNKEREPLFKWVGPLAKSKIVLVGRKGISKKINTIEDAKKVRAIGAIKDDGKEKVLLNLGFTNVDSVLTHEQNAKKLILGRIELFVTGNFTWRYIMSAAGGNPEEFEEALFVSENMLYIAFSKDVSDEVIKRWQKGYMQVVKNGKLRKIYQKWMLEDKIVTELEKK